MSARVLGWQMIRNWGTNTLPGIYCGVFDNWSSSVSSFRQESQLKQYWNTKLIKLPRLYHISLISKPICLLMSWYLKQKNRVRCYTSCGQIRVYSDLCWIEESPMRFLNEWPSNKRFYSYSTCFIQHNKQSTAEKERFISAFKIYVNKSMYMKVY